MKIKTYTVKSYEPGDKLRHVISGSVYTFKSYGFCDTAAIVDSEGTHTWGRKFVDDPKIFEFIESDKT